MLKIKDEVDLKELEKFGFREEEGYMIKEIDNCDYYFDKCPRIMQIYYDDYGKAEIDDTLYDLIQAGLVEKV